MRTQPSASTRRSPHRALGPAAGALLLLTGLALAACGGTTSPTEPQRLLQLDDARIVVAGETVNGLTLHRGHMVGNSTLFEARLHDPLDAPAPGFAVRVGWQRPGPGMMGAAGVLTLYDDGTHGDPFAGDGIYCFEDAEGWYGMHMAGAPFGQYHYDFWGIDHYGRHSNHMQVVITLDP